MSHIIAVGTAVPPYKISQSSSMELSRRFFQDAFPDIDRLLRVFASSQITNRHFCVPEEWFEGDHSFAEKNQLYVSNATELAVQAIANCLQKADMSLAEVDCLLLVSSTGISTPSIDAHLLNRLPFRQDIVRMPLWGLGCAGGAMGLSRATDYCRAYPDSLALLVSVELCGLTFIKSDISKSNLIATSLFADGAAAVLVAGDQFLTSMGNKSDGFSLRVISSKTTTWRDTLDVMGWDMTEDGLRVIFSRDIPSLILQKMRENVSDFLSDNRSDLNNIWHFIFHPGGAKVLEAYQLALDLPSDKTKHALDILNMYGNMSSPTVLFVLEKSLEQRWSSREQGLLAALGPGFSSELILLQAR